MVHESTNFKRFGGVGLILHVKADLLGLDNLRKDVLHHNLSTTLVSLRADLAILRGATKVERERVVLLLHEDLEVLDQLVRHLIVVYREPHVGVEVVIIVVVDGLLLDICDVYLLLWLGFNLLMWLDGNVHVVLAQSLVGILVLNQSAESIGSTVIIGLWEEDQAVGLVFELQEWRIWKTIQSLNY